MCYVPRVDDENDYDKDDDNKDDYGKDDDIKPNENIVN